MLLSQALNEAAIRNLGHPGLLDLGKAISYGEIKTRVAQLSYLYQTEIPYGDVLAILATNGTATALNFFALSNIGCPIFFVNPAGSNEEHLEDFRQLGVKHLVVTGDHLARARELQRSYSLNIVELQKKRGGEYDTSFSPAPERPLKDSDPLLILKKKEYGAGPNYIFFSHKKVHAATVGLRRFYRLLPSDRVLGQINWGHPFGLTHGLLLPLFAGATCAVDPQSPSVEEFVEYIAAQQITRFVGPPKFYLQLLTYCAAMKYTLPGVKSITVGMGSLSLSLRKTYRLLKIPVLRCFGKAEAVWSIAMDSVDEALDVENAKSRALPGIKCKVLDQFGEEVPGPDAREGPLAIMAESVMDGFFNPDKDVAAAATRQALRGTWFYTGEIARLEGEEADTKIAVLGKAADMIASDRGYLSPRVIDEAALKIPGVREAAGFVRTDDEGNRYFACAIVPEHNRVKEQVVLEELKKALPEEFPLDAVHTVESIPLEFFGSVNRQALSRQVI